MLVSLPRSSWGYHRPQGSRLFCEWESMWHMRLCKEDSWINWMVANIVAKLVDELRDK